jgi:dynein heavy chain
VVRIVSHVELNKSDHFTISPEGVIRVHDGEVEFTSLSRWEEEYKKYLEIMKIKLFANFQIWRTFGAWRKFVRQRKWQLARKRLIQDLFVVNEPLRMALYQVYAKCNNFSEKVLLMIKPDYTYQLEEFQSVQLDLLSRVACALLELRTDVATMVHSACQKVLLTAGFTPDDYLNDIVSLMGSEENISTHSEHVVNGVLGGDDSDLNALHHVRLMQQEESDMNYTQQANKRAHCKRLANFILLADSIMVSMRHQLTVNTVASLLNIFEQKLQLPVTITPAVSQTDLDNLEEPMETESQPKSPSKEPYEAKEDEPESQISMLEDTLDSPPPLFVTELLLESNQLVFHPSMDDFLTAVEDVILSIEMAVKSVSNLVKDDFFNAFTSPVINKKEEEKTCGNGPSLDSVFEHDMDYQELISNVKNSIVKAFQTAQRYADIYDPFRQFYSENEATDLEAQCSQDTDVEFFQRSLARYSRQTMLAEGIKEEKSVGLLQIDTKALKAKILPSPKRCLDAIHNFLPVLVKGRMDKLIAFAQDSSARLKSKPSTTLEFVGFLTFVDEVQEKIESVEAELNIIKDLYDLVEEYHVPVPPEDSATYRTLMPSISSIRNAVDKAVGERDRSIDQFCTHLDKDIAKLNKEVKEIKEEGHHSWILDPQTEHAKVTHYLKELLERLDALQERAFTYKSYQKTFKVEVTRFDALEETHAEVKMKQTLWQSLSEWDIANEQWHSVLFEELNADSLSNTVAKYVKTVYQMEKGLPPNGVVPILKAKVESMRDKAPVIVDMRNPALKQRHWDQIETIVGEKIIVDEPLTLTRLTELGVFEHSEEIQEVSGQASSEASLEALLKKVEEAWKNAEYVVLPHRESKDVFILGGTDDIQVLLDDSHVNISTIAGSRHVGPIKSKVEEWAKQLSLFSDTLDEWLTCQRNWLYLESIFSAPDIQRQLPEEAKMFMQVDKSWKEIMRNVNKYPNALRATTHVGRLDQFRMNNQFLDKIQKCLEDYLESKRLLFSRFYFLSNDELLEILSQTRNPLAVQPHLRKCFDSIQKLEFGTAPAADQAAGQTFTNDILAMLSPEGERVPLQKLVKARGNVEAWLGHVEESMMVSLRKLTKASIGDFESRPRHEWVTCHASQVVLTVSQIMWCQDLTECLTCDEDKVLEAVQGAEERCFQNLNKLAGLVRGDLNKLQRSIITALITLDVHARDIVSNMVQKEVENINDFEWQKNLRYYWDNDIDNCVVLMSNSRYIYGYEYLGACPRLVITPLTDRCYLCLMGALQLDLGGAPAGPAGTGKTETVKDLAKALAKQCVVFNCSEGLDFKMMGRFFSGLAQSGAWCCFDEFNRIDIEVLSVIAQQLLTIRNAKAAKAARFMFEGREIKLITSCAAFITMNPGYAGRTELPDNLKALFRPFAMMVPDYALIAEVILYSEGFESSKNLARKMVQMYKLCSEQLSQQDHYDFGMRAVKSVLVMAGSLKRENPDVHEDIVLIRALRDSNLPKFLADDAVLFQAILSDLFPGIEIPSHDYGKLQQAIEAAIVKKDLQPIPSLVKKTIQLYETMQVRHGLMLVGPTGGGKTTSYKVLQAALTDLHSQGIQYYFYQRVHTYVLNPKAVSMGELYGEVNKLTLEWNDGLMAMTVRQTAKDTTDDHKWIICDGPVDALWIENMNTVLDDNKMLCLANSERIKLNQTIHMVFEVQDLAVASPATVSRCGMVYVDPGDLGWKPYVQTWLQTNITFQKETKEYLLELFDSYIGAGLKFIHKKCVQTINQVDLSKIVTVCDLLEALLTGQGGPNLKEDPLKLHPLVATTFVFAFVWGLGGNLVESFFDPFDSFVRDLFNDNQHVKIPGSGDMYGYYVDFQTRMLESWEKIIPLFMYDAEVPYFDLLVPTIDTVRFGFLLEQLVKINKSVLFTGTTGVGKSVIAKAQLNTMIAQDFVPIAVNFSAQTSSKRTQAIIESNLEKKRKNILGAPKGKRIVLFIDDLNMPKLDTYGSQPPVELLRQFQDFRGFYDREKLFWKEIHDVVVCAACAPPGGGRNPITPRLVRHFSMFSLPSPSEHSLKMIFEAIVRGFLNDFPQPVKLCAEGVVAASVEIYGRMSTDLLPTPAKSHYVFNLRDLSKCIQGILQADSGIIREQSHIFRLFCHEAQRTFHDRLIDKTDKMYFYNILAEMASKYFGQEVQPETFETHPIIFGDFMKMGAPKQDRLYEELTDYKKLQNVLGEVVYKTLASKGLTRQNKSLCIMER